jgi:hypothetical protein
MPRSLTATILSLLALVAGCSGNGGTAPPTLNADPTGMKARLLFDDEFAGSKLDKSKWFWCYPNGSHDNCTNNQHGIRYREQEQYRASQLVVGDGVLSLVAVRHSVRPRFPWTSGMVTTGGPFETGPPQPTFAFTYDRRTWWKIFALPHVPAREPGRRWMGKPAGQTHALSRFDED